MSDAASSMGRWDAYRSAFSWRYSGRRMRYLWSETYKRRLMRQVWVALAAAQFGEKDPKIRQIRKTGTRVDVDRAIMLEGATRHDVVAELLVFSEQLGVEAASVLHQGATASDIVDNVDAMRVRESLSVVEAKMLQLMEAISRKIQRYAGAPCMGYTHLQVAAPTTIGYRLAQYGQDLLTDLDQLYWLFDVVKGKGAKGAVGAMSSFEELYATTDTAHDMPAQVEHRMMKSLGLPYWTAATQVYPRKQDYLVSSFLASLAQTLSRFALDVRLMQSPLCGIWVEEAARYQVGSSAMPHKRNPIRAEKICSLARHVAGMTRTAWENAANNALERTLDDSANRRMILPESFLAVDEMLESALLLVAQGIVDVDLAKKQVQQHAPLFALQRVQSELVAQGEGQGRVRAIMRDTGEAVRQALARGVDPALVVRAFIVEGEQLILLASPEKLREWTANDGTEYLNSAMLRAQRVAYYLQGAVDAAKPETTSGPE